MLHTIMASEEQFDVFVSYSTRDGLIAEALAARLKSDGVRYWWAPETLQPGTSYPEIIARDIPRCRVMLVLLSDKANYSHHVERELNVAAEEGKPILPVRIEPVEPSLKLRYALTGAHWLDAFPSFRQHLDAISDNLRARLETLRREAPVVRVLEPVDKFTAVTGTPLRVSFEVLLGTERRLRRARLEVRRDGLLVTHRLLAESERNDHGGIHQVEWQLPESLADGGHFQLAVLAGDTDGQEGSAEMQGSFALKPKAPDPVPAPPPAPVSPAPPKPVAAKPTRGSKAAEGAFTAVFSLGVWSFRLVWMLAITGALASMAHTLAEPYSATQESHIYTLPQLSAVPPPPPARPDDIFKSRSLSSEMLHGAGLAEPGPGLGRFNPPSLEKHYSIKGPREPGLPVTALFKTISSPGTWRKNFHEAIPPEPGKEVTLKAAAWQGAGLGAMLGLLAGIIAGLLAIASAVVQRLPLAMLPLGEEKTFWADFGIVALIVAVTILDTGAAQPETGRWSTPLFWWVAVVSALCFLGSTTLKAALNRKRQQQLLGSGSQARTP